MDERTKQAIKLTNQRIDIMNSRIEEINKNLLETWELNAKLALTIKDLAEILKGSKNG